MENEKIILNLTQHKATAEQIADGVVERMRNKDIGSILTFEALPDAEEIERRAQRLAFCAAKECDDLGCKKVLIGGAPYLMSALEKALRSASLEPVYAFSDRLSEEKEVDGKIVKTQVFVHLGFVEVSK